MKTAITFKAEERARSGKGGARATRRAGSVPVVLYGNGLDAVKLAMPIKDITREYLKGGFKSKVVSIEVGKTTYHAVPRDVQLHPVSDVIEHADFLHVTDKTEVSVMVPVHFKNVDRSVGIKRGGVLNVVRHEIEFVCLPNLIPDNIEIDILERDIGDSIHINDLTLPKGVTPAIKRNFTIATIAGRGKEEEEAPKTAAAEGATAEGAAAPAAGAAAGAAKKPEAKKPEAKK